MDGKIVMRIYSERASSPKLLRLCQAEDDEEGEEEVKKLSRIYAMLAKACALSL